MALIGSVSAIGVVVLWTLLGPKELVSASENARMLRPQRTLNIALWPLMMAVFVLIVAAKVAEIFS